MKKLIILGVIALSFAFTTSVFAATPNWDVTGTWNAQHEFLGNIYVHVNNIVQASNGTLTGRMKLLTNKLEGLQEYCSQHSSLRMQMMP